MTINFDQFPQKKSDFPLIPRGQYQALVLDAEIKFSKAKISKPPYLSMTLKLFNKDGFPIGIIFDYITESKNDFARYKLKRFIEVIGFSLYREFSLKDIAKNAKGKTMLVDVTVDEKISPPRSCVDIFTGEIYYPLNTSTENNGTIK
jgi:hypothetical protein